MKEKCNYIQLTLNEQLKVLQAQLEDARAHEAHKFRKTLSSNPEIRQEQVRKFHLHLIEVARPYQRKILRIIAIMPIRVTVTATREWYE